MPIYSSREEHDRSLLARWARQPYRRRWSIVIAWLVGLATLTVANLERLCEQSVPGRYRIEVVDLVKRPELASADQVMAVPTVVRRFPLPERRVIGTLADSEAAMTALELNSRPGGGG